jgi:HK97 family phage major capsid protein
MPKTVAELEKMKPEELTEVRNNLISRIESYRDRVDNKKETLTKEERDKWVNDLEEFSNVENVYTTTDEGLARRSQSVTLGKDISEVSNALRTLSSSITVKPAFEDDPRWGFKTDNEFLRECMNAVKNPSKVDDRIKAIIINAVGSDEYSRGNWQSAGILIPETMIDRILSMTPEEDFITPRCTRIPMGASVVKIPARVDKNHATSVTGGTRVYRTKEAATVEASKDTFEMVALEANEIVGESFATKQLLRDSPVSIPALIEASMGAANVYKRTDELLNGNGQGMPLGVLNAANLALLEVDRTDGQLDTVIISGMDVIRMAKRVWGYQDAIWIANHDAFEILNTLVIESPNAAGIIKLFTPVEGGGGVMGTLWGRPLFFTEFAPGISTGDGSRIEEWSDHFLSCINFKEVMYGERFTEFNRSVHVRFREREEVFQFVTENDARPWWKTVLTPKNGITTRSPFVTLTNTDVSA